jgi:hypothetical protein
MAQKIRYELSCPQHCPEGRFLGYLYYETNLLEVFNRDERSGFPHNGGQHTLSLRVTTSDLFAFVDLINEQFGNSERWMALSRLFIEHVYRAMRISAAA